MLGQADTARSELIRLASFSKWPVKHAMIEVSFVQLAAAGFSYTGDSDAIACSHCGKVVRGWLGTRHNPLLEHTSPSEEAAGSCCTKSTAPASNTAVTLSPKSRDKPTRGVDTATRDHTQGRLSRTLEADEFPRPSNASSLSRQMAPLGVDDVRESTSGDVRDAAAANSSKSRILVR